MMIEWIKNGKERPKKGGLLTEGVKRMDDRSKSLRAVVMKEQTFSKRLNLHLY